MSNLNSLIEKSDEMNDSKINDYSSFMVNKINKDIISKLNERYNNSFNREESLFKKRNFTQMSDFKNLLPPTFAFHQTQQNPIYKKQNNQTKMNNNSNSNINSNNTVNISNINNANSNSDYISLKDFFTKDENFLLNTQTPFPFAFPFPSDTKPSTIHRFFIKTSLPYPPEIFSLFTPNPNLIFTLCDIFPPLSIIYFIYQSTIIFWNYKTNFQFLYNEIDSSSPIKNIHITFPKPKVFSPNVKYIIFVATQNEIFLLLILPHKNNSREYFEIKKTDFIYTTNNKTITSFASTALYRVFIGSVNESIWELKYENQRSFFGFNKKAKKISLASQSFYKRYFPFNFYFHKYSYFDKIIVDNTRNLLYGLCIYSNSENFYDYDNAIDSKVYIYDLGVDGMKFENIETISQDIIIENCNCYYSIEEEDYDDIIRYKKMFIIKDIIAIKRNESSNAILIIITRCGLRIIVSAEHEKYEYQYGKIDNEDDIIRLDTNKICKNRITSQMEFLYLPLPSKYNDLQYREKQINFTLFDEIFLNYITPQFKCIDVIENEIEVAKIDYDTKRHKKCVQSTSSHIYEYPNETEMIKIIKLPEKYIKKECDISQMLKRSNYNNFLFPNINFLDMNNTFSYTCMNELSTQIFTLPNEYMIMLSSRIIKMIKLRPIDILANIIINDYSLINKSLLNNSTNVANDDFRLLEKKFLSKYGPRETSFMTLSIISLPFLHFYTPNTKEDNYNNEKEYARIENSATIIQSAKNFLFRLINELSHSILNQCELESKKLQYIERKVNFGEGNYTQINDVNNFLSFGMMLFISRIARIFWEMNLYNKDIIFEGNYKEYKLTNALKQHQICYIQSYFNGFKEALISIREKLFEETGSIYAKFNRIDRSKTQMYDCDFYDFKKEFDMVLSLCDKLNQLLSFVNIIYDNKWLNERLENKKIKDLEDLKFKDIATHSNNSSLYCLIEEYCDVIFIQNGITSVENKLNQISMCSYIITNSEIKSIKGNLLIKISNQKEIDETKRKQYIIEGVSALLSLPQNIRIDNIINILCKYGSVSQVIQLCIAKAEFAYEQIEKSVERFSIEQQQNLKEDYGFSEYKKCIYIIFKILEEIISESEMDGEEKRNSKDIEKERPEYINILLKNKSREEKEQMVKDIIKEIEKTKTNIILQYLQKKLDEHNLLQLMDSNKIDNTIDSKLGINANKAKIKIFMMNNEYEKAIQLLNDIINLNNFNENSENNLSLKERKLYIIQLIYTLRIVIEKNINEEISDKGRDKDKEYYLNLLDEANIKNTNIELQLDILNGLRFRKNTPDIEQIKKTLEAKLYSIREMLQIINNVTGLFKERIRMYYVLFSRGERVDEDVIRGIYTSYFKQFNQNSIDWKDKCIFLFDQVFLFFVETELKCKSFSLLLSQNKFRNVLHYILPFDLILSNVEILNLKYFFKVDIDISQLNNSYSEENKNYFWFVKYLKERIKLPMTFIFDEYCALFERAIESRYYYIVLLIGIVAIWCDEVEEKVKEAEKRKFMRQIEDDIGIFNGYNFRWIFGELEESLEEENINKNKINRFKEDIRYKLENIKEIIQKHYEKKKAFNDYNKGIYRKTEEECKDDPWDFFS